MSERRRRLGPRVARITEGVDSIEIESAAHELGNGGPSNHLVVKVQSGETVTAAITRTMDVNSWARRLSSAARGRLATIVVVRNHTRSANPQCQADAWAEARALLLAGATIKEAAQRSGFTELEVRERADTENLSA